MGRRAPLPGPRPYFLSCDGLSWGESGGSRRSLGVAGSSRRADSSRLGALGRSRLRGEGPGPGRGTISLLVIAFSACVFCRTNGGRSTWIKEVVGRAGHESDPENHLQTLPSERIR